MLFLEIVTWVAVGAALGVLDVAMGIGPQRRWATLLAGVAGALVGGAMIRGTGTLLLLWHGYSVAALLVAMFFGLTAVSLANAVADPPPRIERLRPRG